MSILESYPALAAEWVDQRDITSVLPGSGYKAAWECGRGHRWEAPVYRRTAGAGCPYCSGRLAIAGVNDLGTTHPHLRAEWADDSAIESFKAGSQHAVLWQCKAGHTWSASIQNRALKSSGCPYCSGRVPERGKTDLAHLRPDLAAEWADRKPVHLFSPGSGYKARWRCPEGHEWHAEIANRCNGTGCPQCAGRYQDSLAITHPHLADSWDDARDISSVTAGMNARVRWKCPLGHKWTAALSGRVAGAGCPVCSGKKSLLGFNDILTTHPHLASEWADEKAAEGYTSRSAYAARWRCHRGHVWRMSPAIRAKGGACPYCANKLVLAGFNDLGTTHPEIAAQSTSGAAAVKSVTSGSSRRLEWKCERGHLWIASVLSRRHGHGCPTCSGARILTGFNDFASAHPGFLPQWADASVSPYEVGRGSGVSVRWKCEKGHYWNAPVYRRPRSGCPECAASSYVSAFESEISDFVESLGVCTETTVRRFRSQGINELDIFIPSLAVAIEANGVYWHSEMHKGRRYHQAKREACEALGIRLIQVWEDDWADRRPIVERMLAHKLGVSTEPRIPARKTTTRLATTAEAREFLNANHIQGFTGATHHLALEYEGCLVALMSLKRTGRPGELRLERYATAAHVLGGQSKLIRFAECMIPGWSQLITFADREVSDGALYERTGWVKDGELAPDYKYLVRGRRVHKFNYRLARFRNDSSLVFEEGLSERELAGLNGLLRVWDSGKVCYRYLRARPAWLRS